MISPSAGSHDESPAPEPRRALLLDLDGVLFDTRVVMCRAWQLVQERHNVDVPFEDYLRHIGRPFPDIMRQLGLCEAELLHATYDEASVTWADLAPPFPGIEAALRAFAEDGWSLGVVTAKPLNRAAPLLEHLGCPFGTVRTPGSERGKPAPDALLLALVELGADPAQAVYVGDMAVDQEAALRAGVRYIHAGWGYGAPTTPSPLVVETPARLVQIGRNLQAPAASSPVPLRSPR
ncbi:HAD family hydrolase [Streptosporangium sp. NBC_01810]|uniref:HAD family hydrolase n=1 Tax=Streptosporangium sp. NBC_01810 TaxID=2975951 RepID=UPI002DD7CDB8|nr:HAD family hydrolase [Streptosporangium sp. NBC_01810]WSA26651.1 HAD family hydrolase [Streptosporangium sp. NBC_01810]